MNSKFEIREKHFTQEKKLANEKCRICKKLLNIKKNSQKKKIKSQ